MKLPAFQFYPADWRKDPGVQSLDYHDRGVWMELLCLMHESSVRGVLLLNNNPIPEDALARILGLDKQILTTTLTTLLTNGVARRREADGALYSKRMVEDERIIQIRRNAGKLGGNPVLLKQNPTTHLNQNPTPSSSISSSSSLSTTVSKKKDIGKTPTATDAEWLSSLESDQTYSGIQIKTEHGKMVKWCEVNKKQPTRRRFINWLNRADRPMTATATPTEPAPKDYSSWHIKP